MQIKQLCYTTSFLTDDLSILIVSKDFPYLHVWLEIVLACTTERTEGALMALQTCVNHHVPFPVTLPLDNQTTDGTLERFSPFFFWGLAGRKREDSLQPLVKYFPLVNLIKISFLSAKSFIDKETSFNNNRYQKLPFCLAYTFPPGSSYYLWERSP